MTARRMLTLPPLVVEGAEFCVPLCDATAMALAVTRLDPDREKRATALEDLLTADPAFAVWAVGTMVFCARAAIEPGAPPTVASIATWVSWDLMRRLQWTGIEPSKEFTAGQHAQFAALVAETIPAAHDSVRGLSPQEAKIYPRYLAVLCAKWRQWLAAGSDDPDSQAAVERLTSDWPLESLEIAESLSADSRAAGDEAWRRWLSEIPGAQALLPLLVQQARAFQDLQTHFDDALQTAKLNSLKEFAYGAGHELNNPLANIATRAQTLLKEETHPERRRRLAAINSQAFRAHEMLSDMMLFARPPQPKFAEVDLVQVADDVVTELADDAEEQATSLTRTGADSPQFVHADHVQLRVALKALCTNSLEALGRGGNVSIEVRRSDNSAELIVSDDGPGIPAEVREKIFDPFFSGREAGRGLGFGLSKCWRIIALHGGTITVASRPGQGCVFTLNLPVQQPGPAVALSP